MPEDIEEVWEKLREKHGDSGMRTANVRGPITTAIYTLHQVGWTPNSATKWTDEGGAGIDLRLEAPVTVRNKAREAAHKSC